MGDMNDAGDAPFGGEVQVDSQVCFEPWTTAGMDLPLRYGLYTGGGLTTITWVAHAIGIYHKYVQI